MPFPTDLLEPILERPGEREPDVGIVMPIRNTERLVGPAVASVLAQRGCVADIVISDDQSTDGTLAAARRTIEAWRGPHRVRLFRARRRLAIDHLGTLVAACRMPFLVQAHGDDLSRPVRAAVLRDLHTRTGAALVTSLAIWIADDAEKREEEAPGLAAGWVSPRTIALGPPIALAGARLGLDRRIYDDFPPLTSDHLSMGHDALQCWRALLRGGIWLSPRRLLRIRRHADQWSHRLWDTRRPESLAFAHLLHRLAVLRAARRDLAHAEQQPWAVPGRVAAVRRHLLDAWAGAVDGLLDARESLRRLGLEPAWIDVEDLARMKRDGAAAAALLTPPDRRL